MANRLSMATIHSVETLSRSGHSRREIARLLGIDRGTVNAYVRRLKAAEDDAGARPQQADPQTGSDQNQPNPHTGSPGPEAAAMPPGNGAIGEVPSVPSGPPSLCKAYREFIEEKLDQGLSITRIHQDLKAAHGFAARPWPAFSIASASRSFRTICSGLWRFLHFDIESLLGPSRPLRLS